MSKEINCPKLRKQFEELKFFGSEIKTSLKQEKPDVLELRKKQKDFLDLFFDIRFVETVKMTIEIGGKTKEQLLKELEEKDYRVSDTAKEMMGNKEFNPAKKVEKIDLVVLSVASLGFPQGATRQAIYDRAEELGLEVVPQEIGLQLRLHYEDQPMGEWLLIGSEPLASFSGVLFVFSVDHNSNGRWLNDNVGSADYRWDSHDRWVFHCK